MFGRARASSRSETGGLFARWFFTFPGLPTPSIGRLLSPSVDETLLQENGDFYAVLRKVVDDCLRKTSWRWLDSVDDFLAGKSMSYVALVTEGEKALEARLCRSLTVEAFVGTS